jgi:hypothetical protein
MAPRHFVLVAFSVLALAACRKAEVTSYRIPKEAAAANPAMSMPTAANGAAPTAADSTGPLPPGHPAIPANGAAPVMPNSTGPLPPGHPTIPAEAAPATPVPASALTWTAPAEWQAKALTTMRRGSFTVRGEGDATADLSIIAFPGAAGGLVENLNRWRGQVGLASLDAAQVVAQTTVVKTEAGLEFTVADLAAEGTGPRQRLLGAIASYGGEAWFFKLLGPDALVAQTKPAFLAFLKTVKAPGSQSGL